MKIFQALEAAYSAIRSLNSDVGDSGSKIAANLFLATPLAPVLFSFFGSIGLSQERKVYLIAYGLSFVLTYSLLGIKRHNLGEAKVLLRPDANQRERLILVAFLIAFPVVVTVASARSPWLGALAYVLVASIPLRRWLTPRIE